MPRKESDLDFGAESTGGDGSGIMSWMESTVGSESIGETRPGERIRRGSILPTKCNPDLELSGELGTEFEQGLETDSSFLW